jgi:hypothetical protein
LHKGRRLCNRLCARMEASCIRSASHPSGSAAGPQRTCRSRNPGISPFHMRWQAVKAYAAQWRPRFSCCRTTSRTSATFCSTWKSYIPTLTKIGAVSEGGVQSLPSIACARRRARGKRSTVFARLHQSGYVARVLRLIRDAVVRFEIEVRLESLLLGKDWNLHCVGADTRGEPTTPSPPSAGPVAFLRHDRIYRSDVVWAVRQGLPLRGSTLSSLLGSSIVQRFPYPASSGARLSARPLIVRDEFWPAIPRSGCSPAVYYQTAVPLRSPLGFGFSPDKRVSGGKVLSSSTRPTKNRAALALGMAAQACTEVIRFSGNTSGD